MTKKKAFLILILIILFGATVRFLNLNWDHGFYLHPDERAIIMYTLPLHMPQSLPEFFSPTSPLNPHFFAYGSFPLYLLKSLSLLLGPIFQTYAGLGIVGRTVSVIADIGTIILVFLLTRLLFNKTTGLLAAFFYTISVFSIQASHFYAVDILLTFFITLTLYQLILFYKTPSKKQALFVGITFGLSLTTKISATVLVSAILTTIVADFILLFLKHPRVISHWLPHFPRFLKKLLIDGCVIAGSTVITFAILQPYALIDFSTFLAQNLEQAKMTRDAFTFPYTLQYVGITPYVYALKNVFFWGIGPVLGLLSFLGFFYFLFIIFKRVTKTRQAEEIILMVFFLAYLVTVGGFAVGWMRYMLPLYPLFCVFAAVFFSFLVKQVKKTARKSALLFVVLSFFALLIWPLSFVRIYLKPHSRVTASEWINKNIPRGSRLAVEHWDDPLPLRGQEKYTLITLQLYNPDSPTKWQEIHQQLAQADYIILSSNRLYTPLQKLTNCEKLPPGRCYPTTSNYYKRLFDGSLGFKKIAEFTSFPTIPFTSFTIDDQNADESFTVYDHPKVMIFEKQ